MATEEETSRRFQLSLLDLLVVVLFTGLWLWLFAQVGPKAGNLDDYVVKDSSRLQFNAVLIVIANLSIAALTLWMSNSSKLSHRKQTMALALVMGIGMPVFLFLVCVMGHGHQVSRVRNQHYILKCLVRGQAAYQAQYGEYAPNLAAMAAYCPPGIQRAEGRPAQPGVQAYQGYVYKILIGQGVHAAGGRQRYLTTTSDGRAHLTEGFAILAAPYDESVGHIMLMMDQTSTLYARGQLPGLFDEITELNPDEPWIQVQVH